MLWYKNIAQILPFNGINSSDQMHYTYIAVIRTLNPGVAIPVGTEESEIENRTDVIHIALDAESIQGSFKLKATNLGHTTFSVQLVQQYEGWPNSSLLIQEARIRVTVIRLQRLVDLVFNCVMASMSILNSFSMGCCTDWPSLRAHIKRPAALAVYCTCTFLIMPIVSISIILAVEQYLHK